jgi:hypothetical protein
MRALLVWLVVGCSILNIFIAVSNISGFIVGRGEGVSMCPTYGKQSVVISREVKSLNEIKINETYGYNLFMYGKRFLVRHRFIGYCDDDKLRFKGDNNDYTECIDSNAVLYSTIVNIPIIRCDEEDMR